MSERVVVRLFLPLEMGAVARILQAVAREWPDAVIGDADGGIVADDDPRLSKAARKRIAAARRSPR